MPALYDLAFGYRDYEEEVHFLFQAHSQIARSPARRILDVGAGPARHGIAALQQPPGTGSGEVLQVTCIDGSPEMAGYAYQLAIDELSPEQRSKFHYVVDDFRTFDLPLTQEGDQFDSCWILLGSLQHLTQNTEVVQCLSCIHKCLVKNGTVIIELPHPRETFAMIDCTKNDWTIPLEDENEVESGELSIIWGDNDDEFDPITQVRQLTVEFRLSSDTQQSEHLQNVRGVVPTRLFTAQEMDALAQLANFRVAAMFGSLENGVSVNDEDAAFRLVCVLQKQ